MHISLLDAALLHTIDSLHACVCTPKTRVPGPAQPPAACTQVNVLVAGREITGIAAFKPASASAAERHGSGGAAAAHAGGPRSKL